MSADYEHVEVTNNAAKRRYEIHVDHHIAVLEYERAGQQIAFVHAGVPPALEGHGLASKLARTALDDARAAHLSVLAACPFVATYVRRHREYLDLLPAAEQTRVLQDEH